MPKDSTHVEAYGSVDEINSALGLARSALSDDEISLVLEELQKDLFVGAQILQVIREVRRYRASRRNVFSNLKGLLTDLKTNCPLSVHSSCLVEAELALLYTSSEPWPDVQSGELSLYRKRRILTNN